MPDSPFAELVAQVGAFHITDRSMKLAQDAAESALREGRSGDVEAGRYLQAVNHYFSGFEREARAHLRDVDKRLEGLNQVIFNLTAERGVAVKRIEATQSVLARARELEAQAR
jgi:hypothetical protein